MMIFSASLVAVFEELAQDVSSTFASTIQRRRQDCNTVLPDHHVANRISEKVWAQCALPLGRYASRYSNVGVRTSGVYALGALDDVDPTGPS